MRKRDCRRGVIYAGEEASEVRMEGNVVIAGAGAEAEEGARYHEEER